MLKCSVYAGFGYLCGSVLFARVFAALLQKGDITSSSADKNPGTANAFLYGGFWCGVLTLCGDLLKGFLPVHLYLKETAGASAAGVWLIFVLIAPVMGHLFSIFHGFKGGKGIAVTFGCLLGLFPNLYPAYILAFFFLFFSLVVRITPHSERTTWTYRCAAVGMILLVQNGYVAVAFLLIALLVNYHMRSYHMRSLDEKEEKCQVRILWKH